MGNRCELTWHIFVLFYIKSSKPCHCVVSHFLTVEIIETGLIQLYSVVMLYYVMLLCVAITSIGEDGAEYNLKLVIQRKKK